MALDPKLMEMIRKNKNKFSTGTKTVKLAEGKTLVRIIGSLDQIFWRETGVHWIKTEKNGKPQAVTGCHDVTYDKPCPVCAAMEQASKSAVDDETIAIMKDWKAKKIVLVPALIRNGASKSENAQILELTPTTWGKVWSAIETQAEYDVNALDPAVGIDFIIERTGKSLDTEYNVLAAPKSFPVNPEVFKNVPDIDAFIAKEFFERNDEPKALRAIGSMSGIEFSGGPALTGPSKAPALAGPGVHVDDAEIEAAVKEIESPSTAPAAEEAPVATPAPTAKVASPATAPADAFGTTLPDDEIEKMLAELG